jgi:hypothetical protein
MIKFLEDIIHKLLFTCEKATFLIEKKASAESLDFITIIRLKGHLAICKWCRAYNKKVTVIDNAIARVAKTLNQSIKETEIQDFKAQLLDKTLKKS